LALVGWAFAQIYSWTGTAEGDRPLDTVCASWDREASIGIALLVPVTAPLAESQLDYALFQLRRARKNCRAGRPALAREDYLSLSNSHPFPGRSFVDASTTGEKP
jgi:hypothetical protein